MRRKCRFSITPPHKIMEPLIGQNGVETARVCKERYTGRAGQPFKGFDAAACSDFIVWIVYSICQATALQVPEKHKLSHEFVLCIPAH